MKYQSKQIKFKWSPRNLSIQVRIIFFSLFFSFIFLVSLIEYNYFYFKKNAIQQLEENLKNLVEMAYSDINEMMHLVEKGYFSIEEGLEIIKTRFNGELNYVLIRIDKNDYIKNIINLFKKFDIKLKEKEFSSKIEDEKIQFIIIESLGYIKIPVIDEDQNSITIKIINPVASLFYKKFFLFDLDTKNELIEEYKIQFVRNLDTTSYKIGKEGYVYILSSYTPGWMLKNTKFPDDYSLKKIKERFNSNFKDYFNNPEDLEQYLNLYGRTPEQQFAYIENYMESKLNDLDKELGVAVLHPYFEFFSLKDIGVNVGDKIIFPARHISIQKDGFYRYLWKNPVDKNLRVKVAFLKSFEYHNNKNNLHLSWVIGVGAYEDESYYYVNQIRFHLYGISLIFFILIILFYSLFIRISIIKPIQEIITNMKKVNEGDYKVRLNVYGKDEIAYIASTFNFVLRSIRKHRKQLENYANNLKHMVEEKTIELKEALNEIQEIKQIQDGDYYLTYLLLKHLGQNLVKSDRVKVEFFLKQKKEFEFKGRTGEIGGDICIARSIALKEHPFVFFLNADAMGKSMQGAAGVLILGSVMESILERTIQAFIFKNYSPERWLKNSFMELKHIFDSFRGSMGATLTMGLVDEKTGAVYYINAEHPPIILYRNNKAVYINEDFHFRRIGTSESFIHEHEKDLYIKVFGLKDEDSILIGSDGKDDIKLRHGDINTDSNLILKVIEESNCELTHIYNKLLELGEIVDDISMLKIKYSKLKQQEYDSNGIRNEFRQLKNIFLKNPMDAIDELIEFNKRYPEYLPCLKLLLKYYISTKNYKKIEYYATQYFELLPSDNTVLYLLFFSLYKQKKFKEAIEYGERLYLRNPTNINLLLQLAKCHYIDQNFSRTEYLIEKVLKLDPENEKIHSFLKKYNL